MKIQLAFILIIFLIPPAFAISTTMKPIYQPGETLIIEIQGNILEPIQFEDIELKRNNVQVPWEYDVKKLGSKYFLWGIVPDNENNYTLYINNIAATSEGKVKYIDYNQSFSTQGELIPYSIKPGIILTSTAEFEIIAILNRDIPEMIKTNFPEEREFLLNPGENKIKFSAKSVEQGFYTIEIGIYSIPILTTKKQDELIILPKLRFFPKSIESTILLNDNRIYPFSIINADRKSVV